MLSIIVPVYNVEEYLDECIQSILNQTYNDIELILVDDGSSDRSLEICQNYGKKDFRVRVMMQSHKKAAAARNTGIRAARGEFITFVDSDDYIDTMAYERLIAIMKDKKLDVIRGSYCIEENKKYRNDVKREKIEKYTMSGSQYFNEVYGNNLYCVHVGIGIYRRQYILDNDLFFYEGITHEDELWIPRMVIHANKICHVDDYFYYYRYREGSVMRRKNLTQNGIDCVKVSYELAKEMVPKESKKIWNDNVLGKYFFGFTWGKMYRKEYRKRLSKKFVIKHISSAKNAIRAGIYLINLRLFYLINKKLCNL